MSEKLPTVKEALSAALAKPTDNPEGPDTVSHVYDAWRADRLAIAEAVREACAKVANDWEIETGGGVEHDIRALDLAEIVEGRP